MDIPAWISSCVTGGSLLIGVLVFRRDRRIARASQASELMIWQDHVPIDILQQEKPKKYEHVINLDNRSKGIFEFVYLIPMRFSRFALMKNYDKELVVEKFGVGRPEFSKSQEGTYFAVSEQNQSRALLPGQTATIRCYLNYPPIFYEFHIYFADSYGKAWGRVLDRKKLHPTRNPRFILKLFRGWEEDESKRQSQSKPTAQNPPPDGELPHLTSEKAAGLPSTEP